MAAVMSRFRKDCPIIWWLYGRPQPGRTPARRRKGFGAQQRPRAGVNGGAGSQDIIDQHHAASLNPGLPVGRDLEGALDVAGALRSGQADLLLGWPDAPKRFRCHLDAGLPLDGARQRTGLVIAATPADFDDCEWLGMSGNNREETTATQGFLMGFFCAWQGLKGKGWGTKCR
jgi:hypothetical protein